MTNLKRIVRALLLAVGASAMQHASADIRFRRQDLVLPPELAGARLGYFNDIGQFSGSITNSEFPFRPFVWNPEDGTTFFPTGSQGTADAVHPRGMNNLGHVLAYWDSPDTPEQRSWIWSRAGGFEEIVERLHPDDATGGILNDLDQLAGSSYISGMPNAIHATFWDRQLGLIDLGVLGVLPGWTEFSQAHDINNRSEVVGWSLDESGGEAFIWTLEDGMQRLPLPPDGSSYVYAAQFINDHSEVAGLTEFEQPFIWSRENGYQMLGYPPVDEIYGITLRAFNNRRQLSMSVLIDRFAAVRVWMYWDPVNGYHPMRELISPCTPWDDAWNFEGPQIWQTAFNNNGEFRVGRDYAAAQDIFWVPYVPGDLDDDGVVTIADLARLLVNFGAVISGESAYAHGDLDCSGSVDLADLATTLRNFGGSLPPAD